MRTDVAPTVRAPTRPARAWWLAIRPRTLPAAVAPVVVGLGAALGSRASLRPDTALACLAVALLLQILANLANDLFDFFRGADPTERVGPTRVAASGLVSPRKLELAIGLVVVAASAVGVYLVSVGGIAFLLLGALAILAALAYTGGPLPYGYHGLGEVFVFLFFGLVAVAGTAYLQAFSLEPPFVAAAVPVGCLVSAILVVNNLRDMPTDAAAGKRTLAVIFGESFAKGEFVALVAVAAIVPPVMVLAGWAGIAVLLPWVALVLAAPLVREVLLVREGPDRRRLNPVLHGTARLSLVYGLLFAVGLVLGGSGSSG